MKLIAQIKTLPRYAELLRGVKRRERVLLTGAAGIHRSAIAAALSSDGESLFIVTHDEPTAVKLVSDINAFLGEQRALLLPYRDINLRKTEAASFEYEQQRLRAFEAMRFSGYVVVSSIAATLQYTISPKALTEGSFVLKGSFEGGPEALILKLAEAGYHRTEMVEGACTFAARGGIVDFFSPALSEPVRVEFWGDDIDSMSRFSPESQRRTEPVDEVSVTPAHEAIIPPDGGAELLRTLMASQRSGTPAELALKESLAHVEGGGVLKNPHMLLPILYGEPNTALSHIGDGRLFVCDMAAIRETRRGDEWQERDDITTLIEEGVLPIGCDHLSRDIEWFLGEFSKGGVLSETFVRAVVGFEPQSILNITAVQHAPWGGELNVLLEEVRHFMHLGYSVVVLTPTDKGGQTLANDLVGEGITARFQDIPTPAERIVTVTDMGLSFSFELPEIKLCVIAHRAPHMSVKKPKRRKNAGDAIRSLSDITPGDYVVHSGHGIGVFEGVVSREVMGVTKDYIKIRYKGADRLFVQVTQLDMVSKYIGKADDGVVKLGKLGSGEWQRAKSRVKKAVADIAVQLVELYRKRMAAKGHSFPPDDDWQRDFELRFPYAETDDQLRSIAEIKADMQSPRPMDRLLCGDVGFGKTEVAMRAAFKCVMDGKQCAVLVPTTILAWQHYQNFMSRMENFPIKIELMSRFRNSAQQTDTVNNLRTGVADIVVGTHRLLSADIRFKDLGLVVIDEEQRFGVTHKEKFKELKESVDVLTLSATPIPRTLNMAMSSVRDMSLIEEPPTDRHPVATYVLEYEEAVIAEAIRRELRRGGQVFYLHNRVESMDACASRLMDIFPEATVVVANGQMNEQALSSIWQRLVEREIDILVCTTIIETGVDVPNCNTLIIEDADRMGLSQLYQLRGRVGRSGRRAFAYLTFRPGKAISEIATKRLFAIKEMTSFGSGFRIAMRDMELRGAGNLFGAQQSGHMESVGYDLYLKMLGEAVAEETGAPPPPSECTIDIKLSAHIPEDYITDLSQRLDVYKKIAAIQNSEQSLDVFDELIDRYGEPPPVVGGLIEVALVRNRASALNIREVSQRDGKILMFTDKVEPYAVAQLANALKGRVMVNAGTKPYISVNIAAKDEPVKLIAECLTIMEETPRAES